MPSHAEQKIADLIERFIKDSRSTAQPDMASYLAHCPRGMESQLTEALETIKLILECRYQPSASDELVDEGISRLEVLRAKKQRFEKIEDALDPVVEASRHPIEAICNLLGWRKAAQASTPSHGCLLPAHAGVMYRGRGGGSGQATDWLLWNAQLESRERTLCDRAESLLRKTFTDLQAPVDVATLASRLYLSIKDAELEGFDGCLVSDGEVGAIVVNKASTNMQRRRYTIGHEIAHFVLHKPSLKARGFFRDGMGDFLNFDCSDWSEESEANIFASYLLIPSMLFAEDLGCTKPTFADVERIAHEFDVSLAAAARRLIRASNWRSCVVVSSNGEVIWHALSQQFDGWQRPWKNLKDGTAAKLLTLPGTKDHLAEQMPAAFWFEGAVASEQVEVLEESKRLGDSYIYSLLTVVE